MTARDELFRRAYVADAEANSLLDAHAAEVRAAVLAEVTSELQRRNVLADDCACEGIVRALAAAGQAPAPQPTAAYQRLVAVAHEASEAAHVAAMQSMRDVYRLMLGWLDRADRRTAAAEVLPLLPPPLNEKASHVVADDSNDPEHVDDCPGCDTEPDAEPRGTAAALREQTRAAVRGSDLTQVRIAEGLGISQKHLSQMLTGRAVLTLEWAERIAALCGHRVTVKVTATAPDASPAAVSDPGVRGGEPCIPGTRVPAADVLALIADGLTPAEVHAIYPSVSVGAAARLAATAAGAACARCGHAAAHHRRRGCRFELCDCLRDAAGATAYWPLIDPGAARWEQNGSTWVRDEYGNAVAVAAVPAAPDAEPVTPDFFQSGRTYLRRRWHFQCLAVAPSPFNGEHRAVGWLYREGEPATATALDQDDWAHGEWAGKDTGAQRLTDTVMAVVETDVERLWTEHAALRARVAELEETEAGLLALTAEATPGAPADYTDGWADAITVMRRVLGKDTGPADQADAGESTQPDDDPRPCPPHLRRAGLGGAWRLATQRTEDDQPDAEQGGDR